MEQKTQLSMRERFRKNLSDALERSGLTQAQLADRLEISKATVNNWFRGQNTPDMDILPRIGAVLGLPPAELYYPTASEPPEGGLPALSPEARQVARDYEKLDRHGKTVVRILLTEEQKRVEEERQRRRARQALYDEESGLDGQAAEPRVIPLYLTPAAAGMVSPAFGEDFEYLEVEGDVPPQADFAVRLAGDSMEPYLMDGAVAYVNRDPLENGDVGIFFLDGDMLCKQYCRDTEGNVHLFSLNRSRSDADRHIPAESGSTLCCYGRVILPQVPAPPLPEQSRGIL